MNDTKLCNKCGEEKELTKFHKDKSKKDKVCTICKDCKCNNYKVYYISNIDKERCRLRYAYLKNPNKYKYTNSEYRKIYEQKAERKFKSGVRLKSGNAVRSGKIILPCFCEICKLDKKLEMHHEDYNKPLDVNFYCRKCHADIHILKRANHKND